MTPSGSTTETPLHQRITEVTQRYWGFNTLRPLQAEAIQAGLEHRDSLVVMPTGGGKSLCYQVPPIVADRIDIVISPLISLMKDQVDGLRSNGYPAAALHSGLSGDERVAVLNGLKREEFCLLFVSPERLIGGGFLEVVQHMNVKAFAIDEAHCISHWGHDFRPEYRQMAQLKNRFPGASVHAFTATATPRVQLDIVQQLGLINPNVLVGRFDRPNLTFRIEPRVDLHAQIIEVIRRHPKEACIVYCITRKDTESIATVLKANGINAAHYHAGLGRDERRHTQEAFAQEELDVVVATVAFGMGIDRSNVRCVIHAAMPKTVEHYQQETGRAGRDGLEAECVLLYSAADYLRWMRLIERGAEESHEPEEIIKAHMELLEHINGLCTTLACRHKALSNYFGQEYQPPEADPPKSDPLKSNSPDSGIRGCGACDVCLDEIEAMPDSKVIAQKILSCVARLDHSFGIGYVVQVLRGAKTKQVIDWKHDQLSVHGLLKEFDEKVLTNLIYQLINQGLLHRTSDDRPVIMLNDESVGVLKGRVEVKFIEPRAVAPVKTKTEAISWEGVDKGLFEHLRELRKAIAHEREVPAYVVFGDKTLRSMAMLRPGDLHALKRVHGVGEKKLADLGPRFIESITRYCAANDLEVDEPGPPPNDDIIRPKPQRKTNPQRGMAFGMFEKGASVTQVANMISRAESTTLKYLEQFIEERKPEDISEWVDDGLYAKIAEAFDEVGMNLLKPIRQRVGEDVSYEHIKLVGAHIRMRSEQE
ncbi:MAG: RecQ family ATP-dependent DNA helicase [Planctomycetota bacterium]|nr:RecQ family ATP-dependent DNA helicase [Planctomycetota bacterium]